jgi:hypothetical protein
MRANQSFAGIKADLVLYSSSGRSGRGFFWPRSLRDNRTEIYSLRLRVVIGVGLSLALWLFIGLSVAMVV